MRRHAAAPVRRAVALVPLVLAALAAPTHAQPAPLEGLDDYIEGGMAEWEVPGLSIAVVHDGRAVWAQGFGVRSLDAPEPVDENTVFAIGSASKAFTTASLGMLVQEGLVGWDQRATEHLPGFETSDPYVTRELTVRDLVTHRSGLTRGDEIWYATELSREEVLARVGHQPPTTSFRSRFGYNNNMYLAAGQIVDRVTGLSWDRFVERRIFAPLGMVRSSTTTDALEGMENVAQPHQPIDDEIRAIPWRNIDNIAPAGSINSSASEMTAWLRLQLAHGSWNGQRLLDSAVVAEMHAPQTIVPNSGPWALMAPEANFITYGMGWFLHDYRGRKVVQHGGNIDGMHALVGLMPEESLGVVILTNKNPNSLTTAILLRIFDAYLGAEERDWNTELHARYLEMIEEGSAQGGPMEEARIEGTTPSLPLERYAGTYRQALYGEVEVRLEGDGLVARRGPAFVGDLEHWHLDTFRIDWRDPTMGPSYLTFDLDPRARVTGVRLRGVGELERVGDVP